MILLEWTRPPTFITLQFLHPEPTKFPRILIENRQILRVLLRADASLEQGAGHVMRTLSLAEALQNCGHEVHLCTNDSGIPWLIETIQLSGVILHEILPNSFDLIALNEIEPDWIVVDSYTISSTDINSYSGSALLMSIIDGDDRGIKADLFLDHNFGAEELPWSEYVSDRILAGSAFTLLRNSILRVKKERPWDLSSPKPKIIAFMGGSDPTGAIRLVAEVSAKFSTKYETVLISGNPWTGQVEDIVSGLNSCCVLSNTSDLPQLIGNADIAISAAGSSAWELCSLGVPSIFLSVVENQDLSLEKLVSSGLAYGLSRGEATVENISELLSSLVENQELRETFSTKCVQLFDGLGKYRVTSAMEQILAEALR